MGKALDHTGFAEYARTRIQAAVAIRQRHHPIRTGLCACGRAQPCSVARACTVTIEHYRSRLAVIGETLPLPVIKSPVTPQADD